MRIIYIILYELHIPVIIYLYPGIAFLSNLINFCLLMYEPNWLRKKEKQYPEDINICINYGVFFVIHASKKEAIIVEKYLTNGGSINLKKGGGSI